MTRQLHNAIQSDFSRVVEFLKERGIVPPDASEAMLAHAKIIHSRTYCLMLWKFRLSDLPLRGQAFLDEIASDALQILPQSIMGYNKAVKLLIRGIIENTLRHVYFSDHPVEFIRQNQDKKWYINVETLFEYCRSHHHFKLTEPRFDALARLSSAYDQLSAGIHGRTVFDLEMRAALESIVYDEAAVTKDIDLLNHTVAAVNFILFVFHHDKIDGIELVDRRAILRTLPSQARQVLSTFEPSH